LTLNYVVFVVEATTYATPLYDIPYFGSNFPLILIIVTPTLNNETISFEIMIMTIENNFGSIFKI
jgi:hypothetical protein